MRHSLDFSNPSVVPSEKVRSARFSMLRTGRLERTLILSARHCKARALHIRARDVSCDTEDSPQVSRAASIGGPMHWNQALAERRHELYAPRWHASSDVGPILRKPLSHRIGIFIRSHASQVFLTPTLTFATPDLVQDRISSFDSSRARHFASVKRQLVSLIKMPDESSKSL
jgi:hypothetical protein